jgi:hypothetical protein
MAEFVACFFLFETHISGYNILALGPLEHFRLKKDKVLEEIIQVLFLTQIEKKNFI